MSMGKACIRNAIKAIAVIYLILPLTVALAANDKDQDLLTAAYKGQFKEVQRLLNEGANVNVKDELGRTPLVVAAAGGRLDIVKVLLKGEADIDAEDDFHRTAVMWACGIGHPEVAQYLKDRGAKVTLVVAAAMGDVEQAQRLVRDGAHVNAKEFGRPPLIAAIDRGQLEIAKLLLDNGAEVNEKVGWATTPLMHAAQKGHAAVKLILDSGAHVNSNNRAGLTALMSAANAGDPEVVSLLLDKGARINARAEGWTALMHAAMAGRSEVVKLLLDKNADVYVQDEQDRIPLMKALRRGELETARTLLKKRAKKKLPMIDLFDLISYYMIPDSASGNVLPWATAAQSESSIEWTTDGTEPDRQAKEHTKEGKAILTLGQNPLGMVDGEPAPWPWRISLFGDAAGVRQIEMSCNATGGCVDLDMELRKRQISFELYKCDPESGASYNEQIYAIRARNKKKAWLYYSQSSGSAGCAGNFTLFLNKEDADQSDEGLSLVTDCKK